MSRPILHTSPFLHAATTTPRLMWEVVLALLPLLVFAIWVFGLAALVVSLAAVLGCLVTEWMWGAGKHTLFDGSALITGLLLAFCLPPGFPAWMAFLGGVVAIGMGKLIWGGLGQNVFNPALVGRAFLQAAFPEAITTWENPGGSLWQLRGANLAWPLQRGSDPDAISAATPLAEAKWDQQVTATLDLLWGYTAGSLGETCGILLLLLGVVLAWRGTINWRIPTGILGVVAVLSGLFHMIDPGRYPPPQFMLLAGGLLLGAIFMATDYVSSPLTNRGIWIYAIGIGVLVVMIRLWGGLPEGVMYAILLMNAAVPLIHRFDRTRVYGAVRRTDQPRAHA